MGKHPGMPRPLARTPRNERAALVGLIAGRARRLDAERSLDELGGLAQAAGAKVVLRMLQERPEAGSVDVPRRRQDRDPGRILRRDRR